MSVRALTLALVSVAGLFIASSAERAYGGDYWKHPVPGAPWIWMWGQTNIAALEPTLQGSCKNSHPSVANPAAPDNGGRYLAVLAKDWGMIEVHCYYSPVIETVHKNPDLRAGNPEEPPDYFNPYDGSIAKGQIANLNQPYYVPNPGTYLGALELHVHPGFCITVQNSHLEDGAPVTTFPCDGGENQKVYYSSGLRGQIVVWPNSTNAKGQKMCLDYYPGQGNPGDQLHIWPCHQITYGKRDSQIWWPVGQQLKADGSSAKPCLDSNSKTGPGYLVLTSCQPGNGKDTPFDWEMPRQATVKAPSGSDAR